MIPVEILSEVEGLSSSVGLSNDETIVVLESNIDITLTLPPRLKVARWPTRLKSVIRRDKMPVPI